MADTTVQAMNGSNDLNINALVDDGFKTAQLGLTAYFANETAKSALKAPTSNVAILVGGVLVVVVLIFVAFKKR